MPRLLDLTGQTYGCRTVLGRMPNPTGGAATCWKVRCRCGQEDVVPSQRVRKGTGCRSCGNAAQWANRLVDLTGEMFGKWQVLGQAPNKGPHVAYHVRCTCGKESHVTKNALTTGRSLSCKSCGSTKYDYKVDLDNPTWCWLLGLFHGDGCTSLGDGGVVNFAARPPENQIAIVQALVDVGITQGVGVNANGVNVYSVTLARDMARFKTSGLGKEAWMLPELPTDLWAWIAGIIDADGWVRKDGRRVRIYQKQHGGMTMVRCILSDLGVRSKIRQSPHRDMEVLTFCVEDLGVLKTNLHLRFPKKQSRLALFDGMYPHSRTWMIYKQPLEKDNTP